MKKSVTMSDIAKHLKISNVTVSNALSDKDGVSEELREKIKVTALELGYKFQPGKKSDRQTKSENIGFIIPERYIGPYGSFYWALYNAIIQELRKYNCYGMLDIIPVETERELRLPKMISEGGISGLILIGQISNDYAEFISRSTDSYIFVDFYD
ncbi:MAG: LacI family DNA-binding transcriptional regulator, partial [Oscillospiraceae bacterium]